MKFSALIVDGSFDGKVITVEAERFSIGMHLQLTEFETYVVQPGPIAELLEQTQESSDVLTVRAKLLVKG